MTDEPLLRKLQVKYGRSLRLIAAPDEYVARITPLPGGSELVAGGVADVVQVFVRSKSEVAERAGAAIQAAGPTGVLWMTYPKTSAAEVDIGRDAGWDPLQEAGWQPETQISIDETWSAVRFRPEQEIAPRAR